MPNDKDPNAVDTTVVPGQAPAAPVVNEGGEVAPEVAPVAQEGGMVTPTPGVVPGAEPAMGDTPAATVPPVADVNGETPAPMPGQAPAEGMGEEHKEETPV